jgi:hypothetical protein
MSFPPVFLRFSRGTPVSSNNKTDRHDITEILLKVALNTIKQINLCMSNQVIMTPRSFFGLTTTKSEGSVTSIKLLYFQPILFRQEWNWKIKQSCSNQYIIIFFRFDWGSTGKQNKNTCLQVNKTKIPDIT